MKHKADDFWKGPKKFYRDPYGRDICGSDMADKFIDNCKKDRMIIYNSQKNSVHLDDFENAGIYRHCDVQAYPEYANKNDRLTTFDKWPKNVLTHQSSEDLAEAGFLYTGIADFVVSVAKEDATTRQCGEDDREKKIKSIKENSEMEENYSLLRDCHQYDKKNTNSTNIDDENIVKEKEETKRQINDVEEGGEKKKICIIDKCRECLDKPSEIVYLPCAHMILCVSCTLSLKNCPSCKEKIKYAFRPIL
ncbi:Apoptosis inhibitor IAP [Armadillidium vulgare]|nr:Apoptosis inhibitor IAP [Armadillidium vulgare]